MPKRKDIKEDELERLRQEISNAQAKQDNKNKVELVASSSSPVWVSTLEIAVSTIISGIIGYFLDKFFDTHFIMIIFILLGAIAGWNNITRVVRVKKTNEEEK